MAADRPHITCFAPFGSFGVHHQVDAVLATALRLRDCDVSVIRCDGIFRDCCDVLSWSGENSDSICAGCVQQGNALSELFNLPTIELRAQLTEGDWKRARAWSKALEISELRHAMFDGRPIGEWVISSMCTFFRTTATGLDQPHIHALHRKHLLNAALTALAIERIYDQVKPTGVIVFNGRFAIYRVAAQIAKDRGIRVLCHERGFTDDSFAISGPHMAIAAKPLYEAYETWGHIPMDEDDLAFVKNHLIKRQSGQDLNWTPYYSYTTNNAEVLQQLNIPANVKIFGCFTSSEFEVAYCDDFPSMPRQLDYVENLIEVFRDRPDYLVIRHHPYIVGNESTAPDGYFMRRAHDQARSAPSNVRVIMPYEQLTSYSLLPHLSGCISLMSTVGVEASAQGIPTMSLHESPSRDAYNTHITTGDRCDFERALTLLENMTELDRIEQMRKSYRYMSILLQRISTKFQSIGIKSICQADIRISNSETLRPGYDEVLDRLCDYLVHGSPWLEQPQASHLARSTDCEDGFLRKEVENHDSARELLRQRLNTRLAVFSKDEPQATAVLALGGMNQTSQTTIAKRAEHTNIYSLRSGLTLDFGDNALAALTQQISQVSEPFVLATWDGIEYDESFLSTSQKALENPAFNAACCGIWISAAKGKMTAEAFTTRKPLQRYDQAVLAYPWLDNGIIQLSRVVCRRQWLVDVLNNLVGFEPSARAGALFEALHDPDVAHSPNPLVILNSSIIQAVSEFLHERPNTAESIKELALILIGQNEFERVVELVKNARTIGATARDLEYLGAASLLQLQRVPEARYALARELVRYPENDEARKFYRDIG